MNIDTTPLRLHDQLSVTHEWALAALTNAVFGHFNMKTRTERTALSYSKPRLMTLAFDPRFSTSLMPAT